MVGERNAGCASACLASPLASARCQHRCGDDAQFVFFAARILGRRQAGGEWIGGFVGLRGALAAKMLFDCKGGLCAGAGLGLRLPAAQGDNPLGNPCFAGA